MSFAVIFILSYWKRNFTVLTKCMKCWKLNISYFFCSGIVWHSKCQRWQWTREHFQSMNCSFTGHAAASSKCWTCTYLTEEKQVDSTTYDGAVAAFKLAGGDLDMPDKTAACKEDTISEHTTSSDNHPSYQDNCGKCAVSTSLASLHQRKSMLSGTQLQMHLTV